jgi:hypothetical protein
VHQAAAGVLSTLSSNQRFSCPPSP